MANMRDIKNRMKSIRETRQITNAMKLIAAAKLRKAKEQLEQTLPFFNKIKLTILDITSKSGDIESKYFDLRNKKDGNKKGYIIISGDKTLAGGYNHNLQKMAEEILKQDTNSELFVAGHIGRNYLEKKGYNVNREFDYGVQNPTVCRAREIAEIVLEKYNSGEIDEVYVIYTHMVSPIKLEPRMMKLLPLELEELRRDVQEDVGKDYKLEEGLVYEPSPSSVLDVLIPKYLKGIVYGCFVQAFTSEQSARMTAMDNATENADEMLQKLNLYYNRARQAAITQEISEIVGGATVLQ